MRKIFKKQQHDFNAVWNQTNIIYCKWAEYFGLNYSTLMTLYGLDVYGSMTQKNICDFYGFPKQTVNGIIHDLMDKGYVLLETGTKDKREKLIVLTEKGRDYTKELLEPLYKAEKYVFSTIGDERISQMLDTINVFNILIEKCLEEIQ